MLARRQPTPSEALLPAFVRSMAEGVSPVTAVEPSSAARTARDRRPDRDASACWPSRARDPESLRCRRTSCARLDATRLQLLADPGAALPTCARPCGRA